jgi:hypothetical protein
LGILKLGEKSFGLLGVVTAAPYKPMKMQEGLLDQCRLGWTDTVDSLERAALPASAAFLRKPHIVNLEELHFGVMVCLEGRL